MTNMMAKKLLMMKVNNNLKVNKILKYNYLRALLLINKPFKLKEIINYIEIKLMNKECILI